MFTLLSIGGGGESYDPMGVDGLHLLLSMGGDVSYMLNYRNGKKHGLQISWLMEDLIQWAYNYIDGDREGEQIMGQCGNMYHVGIKGKGKTIEEYGIPKEGLKWTLPSRQLIREKYKREIEAFLDRGKAPSSG